MPDQPDRPSEAVAEAVFVALADPNRRAILAALAAGGPATATDLADALPITRQGIAKHLARRLFDPRTGLFARRLRRGEELLERPHKVDALDVVGRGRRYRESIDEVDAVVLACLPFHQPAVACDQFASVPSPGALRHLHADSLGAGRIEKEIAQYGVEIHTV